MAELGNERTEAEDMHWMVTAEDVSLSTKRALDRTSSPEPPPKSPRTSSSDAVIPPLGPEQQPDDQKSSCAEVGMRETMAEEVAVPDLSSRRKSWRRSTKGRRSLPAFPTASQSLCKSISPDLTDEERLEKLMGAAMQLAVKRLENTLQTLPGSDMEALQTQVESMHNEWNAVAKTIREENSVSSSNTNRAYLLYTDCHVPCQSTIVPPPYTPHWPVFKSSGPKHAFFITIDPALQKAIIRTKEAISRLQAESLSWESLLNKHRSKAEELAKRVELGEESSIALDPSCLAKSSQSRLIQDKPDYQSVLHRQQRVLSTMELVLDSQCMMMQSLRSFHEQSQLVVKETSARLAQRAGIQDLPSSPVRQLLNGPLSATST